MSRHLRRRKEPAPYVPPVDALLTLGHPAGREETGSWYTRPFADYAAMGLAPGHVPELLRMMRDPVLLDSDGDAFFGCVHAARAVGALGGMEAWMPLVDLTRRLHRLEWDFWIDDLSGVFAAIGPEVLDPAMRLTRDHREIFGFRLTFLGVPEQVAARFPECRARIIGTYTRFLDEGAYDSGGVNEFIVEMLLKLSAVDALPAIERAFSRGYINDHWCGTLEQVRGELAMTPEERGVELKRTTERIRAKMASPDSSALLISDLEELLESDS